MRCISMCRQPFPGCLTDWLTDWLTVWITHSQTLPLGCKGYLPMVNLSAPMLILTAQWPVKAMGMLLWAATRKKGKKKHIYIHELKTVSQYIVIFICVRDFYWLAKTWYLGPPRLISWLLINPLPGSWRVMVVSSCSSSLPAKFS